MIAVSQGTYNKDHKASTTQGSISDKHHLVTMEHDIEPQ